MAALRSGLQCSRDIRFSPFAGKILKSEKIPFNGLNRLNWQTGKPILEEFIFSRIESCVPSFLSTPPFEFCRWVSLETLALAQFDRESYTARPYP